MIEPKSESESELATMIAPVGSSPGRALISDDEATSPMFGDRYEVMSLLGSGGMGTVYMARDRELDEIVALKVLRSEVLTTPGALEMFKREVKLARRVTHPNVARTFDIGEWSGSKYLTMEYIEGTPLARIIDRFGGMPLGRVIGIARQIAAGLGAAHAVGIVHRDLKPENVLVRSDERIVITDFGIAKPVEAGSHSVTMGVAVGTPAYMAPEQVEARRDIDGRADIYAFGILLYELLTGDLPFTGDSALAVAAARLVRPPPDVRVVRRDVPDAIAELVLRCMARDREQRFASTEQVLAMLGSLTAPISSSLASGVSLVASAPPVKTVAVLPFRDAGPADEAHTAEGLLDDLIDGLSMTDGIRVRPRSAVARFVPSDRDAREIGRELGVDVVVEGSVRRQGDLMRVSARLINVADGFQLWAKRFDRPSRDLFALSDEMAETIARALTLSRDVPARGAPIDTTAMDLYLKARVEFRKAFSGGSDRAAELFRQALERAPDDPTILASYAVVQVRRWFFGDVDAVVEARAAAERALLLAPHLVEARFALSVLKLHSGDTFGAFKELREIVSKSAYGPAYETIAGLLNEANLGGEARHFIDLALQVDPLSVLGHIELARFYALEGQWDEVDLVMERVKVTPTGERDGYASRIRFAFWKGSPTLEDVSGKFRGPMGPVNEGLVSLLTTNEPVDRDAAAARFARDGASGSKRRGALIHQIEAEVACFKGDPEWALAGLHRAVEMGLFDIAWLRRCPMLVPVRVHPGYAEIERVVAARADELVNSYRNR